MSQIRDQIISFLLQSDDSKERIIAELQKQITQLSKDIEAINNPQPAVETAAVKPVNGKAKVV